MSVKRRLRLAVMAIIMATALFVISSCASTYEQRGETPAEIMVKVENYTECDVAAYFLRPGGVRAVTVFVGPRFSEEEPSVAVKFVRHGVFGFGEQEAFLVVDCGNPITLGANNNITIPNEPVGIYVRIIYPITSSSVQVRRRGGPDA